MTLHLLNRVWYKVLRLTLAKLATMRVAPPPKPNLAPAAIWRFNPVPNVSLRVSDYYCLGMLM
jgi:hypothetical protein